MSYQDPGQEESVAGLGNSHVFSDKWKKGYPIWGEMMSYHFHYLRVHSVHPFPESLGGDKFPNFVGLFYLNTYSSELYSERELWLSLNLREYCHKWKYVLILCHYKFQWECIGPSKYEERKLLRKMLEELHLKPIGINVGTLMKTTLKQVLTKAD